MSVKAVILAEIRSLEDLVETITLWIRTASEEDRLKFDGFIAGLAPGSLERVAEIDELTRELTAAQNETKPIEMEAPSGN